jgi:hypothetical protein
MPQEFKVKNGLIVDQGGATITGSVIATGGFTGSLQGTSSWATNALTASFISTASTNAFVQGGNSFGTTALLGTNDNQSLAFETNGSTRMLINSSSGNIGIGTTSPADLLTINANAANARIRYNNSDSVQWTAGNNASDNSFRIGNALNFQLAMFQATGNLLLQNGGTFTDAGYRLDVSGSARINGGTTISDTPFTIGTRFLFRGDGVMSYGASGDRGRLTWDGSGAYFHAQSGYGLGIGANGSLNNLFINTSGNVGIGTTTQTARLQVRGSGATSATTALRVENTNASASLVVLDDGKVTIGRTDGAYIEVGTLSNFYNTSVGYNHVFRVGGTEVARIAGTGNVLIGTSTDSARLYISGAASSALLKIDAPSANDILYVSGSGTVGIGNTGVTNTALAVTANGAGGGNYILQGYDSSAVNRFLVTATGRLQMTGTTDTGTSGTDERVRLTNTFNPTSGTREHIGIYLVQAVSQSGGANGITRGLYIQPTLTSAANYRAIETTSGSVLFSHGSSTLLFASSSGNVGVGTTSPVYKLDVSGSGRFTNNLSITGSLIASGTYGGINTVSNKPNLFDINGITRVQWSDGVLNSSANDTTVDWENKVLYDSTTNTALDWENRGLYDTAGSPSIDWTGRILSETTNTFKALDYSNDSYLDSQLYYRNIIPGQVQQALSDSPLYAGQVIQATVDAGVTDYDLVSLDTDGTWKSVKAAVGYGADKMLGICVDQAGGYILIEGDVGVSSDDSQGAYVAGANYGLPIYASTTTGEMTTTAPSGASSIVRVVGHIYYQSATDTNWWTMKFRPSNDWYVI